MNPWLLLPSTIIIFREVFISGLREFLGATSKLLAVTRLAKWKTTAQMVAIAVLFASGIFEHFLVLQSFGMDTATINETLAGRSEDVMGLRWKYWGMNFTFGTGVALLWLAAALTLLTGWDYFRKALPYLRDETRT
jgi:CDP-diacylglycerol--glycerol-3-phosphate 3-phosphatidyltransferase